MKLFKYLLILTLLLSNAYSQANKEFRATWVITWDLVNRNKSAVENQAQCRQIMDNHLKANMNAVLWQVRQNGTVYYESSFEPWGSYAGSRNPGYDLLAYAVEEAHKRGLELHAWFNVFKCPSMVPGAPAYEHPEWVCTDMNGEFMTAYRCLSPGMAEVREYLLKLVMEILRKYDIDGIHFDYIRWNEYSTDDMQSNLSPEDELEGWDGEFLAEKLARSSLLSASNRYIFDIEHPYSDGVPAGFRYSDEWRRWCVTEFVRVAHDSIQAVKPWVRLSVAALGKYRWTSWQGFGYVFQDAALWFNEGFIDQLTPMHYHWLDGSSFYKMLVGPAGDSNYDECWGHYIQPGIADGRLFSCGPGSYRLLEENVWYKHEEIVNSARRVPWVDGFQFFSYGEWFDQNYWQEAAETFFQNKAKVRGTGLIENVQPAAPSIEVAPLDTFVYDISVSLPTERMGLKSWIALYRAIEEPVDKDRDQIVSMHFGESDFSFTDYIPEGGHVFRYYATLSDRFRNESVPSNIYATDYLPEPSIAPEPVVIHYLLRTDEGYKLKWQATGENDATGFRIYGKLASTDWQMLMDEQNLDQSASEATLQVSPPDSHWTFMVKAVGKGPKAYESSSSDMYGAAQISAQKVLIVDGFDLMDDEYKELAHPLAQRLSESLSRLGVSHDCCSDDAIELLLISLAEYRAVFWILGTDNPEYQRMTYAEMSRLAHYLRLGGQLFISGSALVFNLAQKGDSSSQLFLERYLRAKYVDDGRDGNGYAANGVPGRLFDGLFLDFDEGQFGFEVMEPDVIDTTAGSLPCLRYTAGDGIAGIQFTGVIEDATEAARVVAFGFPLETVYPEARRDTAVARVLEFFALNQPTAIRQEAHAENLNFQLLQNYPNPFNAETVIRIFLRKSGQVNLEILNLLGQRVALLEERVMQPGTHAFKWRARGMPAGLYLVRMQFENLNRKFTATRKILVIY
ncbi:family 10 glycosylhydrolase [candidate division KSB1 bacterium]|nr:family 10 glycosylhydrolase [candidate division KSB1 bacterium]